MYKRQVGDYADYVDFANQRIVRHIEVLDDAGTGMVEESLGLLETPAFEPVEVPPLTVPESEIVQISTNTEIKGDIEITYYQDISKKLAELQKAI